MPLPLPRGKSISVKLNSRPASYSMQAMELATDHYNISYCISGDRRVITPLYSYTYHAGNVSVGQPYMYHRTVPESDEPYINYQIKFTPDFIRPFIENVGQNVFDEIYSHSVWEFTDNTSQRLKAMFSDMLEEYGKQQSYTEFILQGMLYRLLLTVYENKLNKTAEAHTSELTAPIIDTLYYIESNFASNITLEEAAGNIHFSVSHFSRVFHAQLGVSFSDYVSSVRLKHAKDLLINSDKSITEIALESGYTNGDYFSAQFKKKTGITPSAFRKNYHM